MNVSKLEIFLEKGRKNTKLRNTVVNINDINKDYISYEFYKNNSGKIYNPKKSMLKFIKAAAEITLTPLQKMYFEEFFIKGKTINEIALETGRHKSTVSRQVSRVKEKLRLCSKLYF